jgi:hypothetical protein
MIAGSAQIQSENQVEAQIIRYLQKRGWVVDRIQVGLLYTKDGRPVHVGRPGQPDWRANHPRMGYLEVEIKATNGKLSQRQREYLASREAMGFQNITWASSLEMFQRWYESRYGSSQESAA